MRKDYITSPLKGQVGRARAFICDYQNQGAHVEGWVDAAEYNKEPTFRDHEGVVHYAEVTFHFEKDGKKLIREVSKNGVELFFKGAKQFQEKMNKWNTDARLAQEEDDMKDKTEKKGNSGMEKKVAKLMSRVERYNHWKKRQVKKIIKKRNQLCTKVDQLIKIATPMKDVDIAALVQAQARLQPK